MKRTTVGQGCRPVSRLLICTPTVGIRKEQAGRRHLPWLGTGELSTTWVLRVATHVD
jgi:hypothetical protein